MGMEMVGGPLFFLMILRVTDEDKHNKSEEHFILCLVLSSLIICRMSYLVNLLSYLILNLIAPYVL